MITIKTTDEINKMRHAGQILAEAIHNLKLMIKPGVNVLDLDKFFEDFITQRGCKSNFKGYHGFPKSICVSINEQLVHGIPTDRVIMDGDIVSVDTGCSFEGYHSDSAFTMVAGIAKEKKSDILIKITEQALEEAIKIIKPGTRLGTIGYTISNIAKSEGFGVPKEYTGHGIGKSMHEDPFIPNYGTLDTGLRLQAGMVICIEPMFQIGTDKIITMPDKWTVCSADRSMAAHFEHTILVTEQGSEVLTRYKGDSN